MMRLLPFHLIGKWCRIGAGIVLIINCIQLVISIFTGYMLFDSSNKLDKMANIYPNSQIQVLNNFALYVLDPFLSTIITIIFQVAVLYVISMVADYVAARQAISPAEAHKEGRQTY